MEEQVGQVGTRDKILRGERKTRKGDVAKTTPARCVGLG